MKYAKVTFRRFGRVVDLRDDSVLVRVYKLELDQWEVVEVARHETSHWTMLAPGTAVTLFEKMRDRAVRRRLLKAGIESLTEEAIDGQVATLHTD